MPAGYQLTFNQLRMPDGSELEFTPLPPDDQFGKVFRTSCRSPLSSDAQQTLDAYTLNVALTGPGGSLDCARRLLEAGGAIVRAGGAGVFIDNSALSHDGQHWIEMSEDSSSDAVSFAFVNIISGPQEVWTLGMHILGFPDISMSRSDIEQNGEDMIEVIRYISRGRSPIGNGHILADESGPRFQATAVSNQRFSPGSPMFNPFGRLKLVSVKEIVENN